MTQAEEEDVAHILEFVDEVEVKDVVGETRKTKVNVTPRKNMKKFGKRLTYYLGIEVSQGKDCIEIKQERYAMKILKEDGMEDCNVTLCPMEPRLKFSKAEDEPEVETTQYRKMVGCLRFLLHTRPDLTYSIGVDIVIVVIMLTLMMDEALVDTFFILVHHLLHGAHKRKLSWHYLHAKLSSWEPLQLRVKQFGFGSYCDRWTWNLESSGEFSVKSARVFIDDSLLPKANAATGWIKVVTIKINIFACRVCLDKLPTRLNLYLRGVDIPSILYLLCSITIESSSHILFSCHLARQLMIKVARWWDLDSLA
nr:RNA-directed DNA polymerase, eukaryota [Tanacetum cinerariifolium]